MPFAVGVVEEVRCLICASTGADAADGSSNAREFIACPRCHQLLYCSANCAEVGWFGHRAFCEVQSGTDAVARLATTRRKKCRQQERRSQLENALRNLASVGKGSQCHLQVLRLLEAIFFTDDFTGDVVVADSTELIKESVELLTAALSDSESTAETTAITLLLSGLLSLALGNNEAALAIVRRGLAKLIPYKSEEGVVARLGLLEAERVNLWTRRYPKVVMAPGETPRACRRIMSGEVVACDDVPLLAWEANGFPPASAPRQTSVYDDGLRALVDAFLLKESEELTSAGLPGSKEDHLTLLLNGLHGVRDATADAIVAATTYLTAFSDGPPPCWMVKLFFTSMASRRCYCAKKWGFFDLVSRVSHSCSPNCIWNSATCELRALRSIDAHEPLTIDNFWRPRFDLARQMVLKLPVPLRQESVRANVGCCCTCSRCTGEVSGPRHACGVMGEGVNGTDALRAFPCPLCRGEAGWRYRLLSHTQCPQKCGSALEEANRVALQCRFASFEPWVCHRCGERWRDSEMPAEEMRLCRQAERLVSLAARGIIARNFFEETKDLMRAVSHCMGQHHHSVYLLTCEAFVLFYRYIASRFAPPTGVVAQNHTVLWCRKWIRCAQNTNLSQDCPHVYASFIADTSRSLTALALRIEKVLLLRHAEAHCPTAVIHGADSSEAADVAAILKDAPDKESPRIGQSPSAFERFMNAEQQEDEDALISDWESHILGRVQSEIQSSEKPKLPAHMRKVLQR
ncbi:uncharacterized protein Tco025E_03557 [Trypanosoma conorhini]|uniref:MYND-type domain-containing protein n=1 Tax=Trypanosoma conorhini TaxID=83891 RepID=A0A3R7LD69_9TRYP|nr:uncharacterized protein Tco025E_03557 [Trypanosoma conorhini]RNF21241.1 hypothetical protein Tco025E_03557 [Trypanosoma conorhini]